ncbi:MAG: M48 family metalloprotease [Deltaproteobacteria bacterium]|nr:M48 family metalloprotease [Deltaproteobacteria bacterium]MBI4223815.1 M48 family metalloprotease [Deltaproteobacteria bacterium]
MKKLLIVLSGLSLLATCSKDPVTGKSTHNYYSLASDIKLGQQVMASQQKSLVKSDKKMDMEADAEEYQRIRRIVQRIIPLTHVPNFPYESHLADVEVVNAWCAPGGKIMVYTGLWDKEKGLVTKGDENELAAVIGHEIAHATARHVTERLSTITTLQIAGAVASSAIASGGSAQGSDLFNEVFTQGMNVYVPSYSRKAESEADRLGLIYMAEAGYNPEAAVRLWERAAKKRGDQTSVFASHPASGERAKALKALLPRAMEIYQEARKKYR